MPGSLLMLNSRIVLTVCTSRTCVCSIWAQLFSSLRLFVFSRTLSIRYEAEFEPLLLLKTPLLANFTYRGDPKSDKLTGVLNRIVSEETDYRISAVDIEADEPTTRDLLLRYSVCIN